MAKLRKMLGSIQSEECVRLMGLIETQSRATLAAWAVEFAANRYLPLWKAACPEDGSLDAAVEACRAHLAGERKLAQVKPALKEAVQTARSLEDSPAAQAAARAVSTACGTVNTPTNALGFLFYGAAAVAYHEAGLMAEPAVYDELARREFRLACDSLREASVPDEPNPAKINWNC